jgi:cytochrome c oxidase subunit 3
MSDNPLEHRDDVGARMAMWLFLFTEVLLFGVFFIIYTVYRMNYLEEFHHAASQLNSTLGAVNTVVLLTSSLTMVLSIVAIQKDNKKWSMIWLIITIACAVAFLVNKYFEYAYKFDHGIYLNSEVLNAMDHGSILFYGLYFVMTGLHGIHILAGIFLLAFMLYKVAVNSINHDRNVMLENAGLYWHIVDLIWIFLFPLFYLIA